MRKNISTVTAKGLVTIPLRLRRKFGIRRGTRIAIMEEGNRIILQPLTTQYIHSLPGSLKGEPSVLKYLMESRKQDREL
jgi:AbrB family looped-hinge helix DNA binding protein